MILKRFKESTKQEKLMIIWIVMVILGYIEVISLLYFIFDKKFLKVMYSYNIF